MKLAIDSRLAAFALRATGSTSSLLVVAIASIACAVAHADEGSAAAPTGVPLAPVQAYAAIPAAREARLSPSGHYLAYIGSLEGHTALVVKDLQGRERPRAIPTGAGEVSWILWKSDARLVMSVRVVSGRQALRRTIDTRLIGVDRDGSHVTELIRAEDADYTPQVQDHVLSELPDDPDHLLVQLPHFERAARTPVSASVQNDRVLHPEVVRVDVHTGMTETVVRSNGLVNDWLATAHGTVDLGWSVKRDRTISLLGRDSTQADWRTVQSLSSNQGSVFDLLAWVDETPNHVYVASNHEGGHVGIYEFDVQTARFVRSVKVDARHDIGAIVQGERLRGYEDEHGPVYLDAGWAAAQRLIDKALAHSTNWIIDRSSDGQSVLVSVVKGNEPRDYWLLTRRDGKADLEPVTDNYPLLSPEQIGPSRWVHYDARDGLGIPALVTLPPGRRFGASSTPLPFVVLPHGGPSAHDDRGFDYWVQFLASRGYGVLQPQFRGSTGYGRDFLTAGYRQWGLAMQDDVTDGTRWLVREGLADPKRIAIVGASYGGYAALMGVAKEPSLYRCAIAIAPVTDLLMLAEDEQSALFGDLNLPQIGQYGSALEQTSPLQLADRIVQPVLLVHGRKDYTVPVQHTEAMSRALARQGKASQTVYMDEADHYFTRSADREVLLASMEEFLARNLK